MTELEKQLLGALKHCHAVFDQYIEHHLNKPDYEKAAANERHRKVCAVAIAAAKASGQVVQQYDHIVDAAKMVQAEPVAYLMGGSRYKVTHSEDHGVAITGLPPSMNGQWVAFVDATDNKHLQARQPVAVPDGYVLVPKEPTTEMQRAGCAVPLNKAARHNTVYRAMIAAYEGCQHG